MNSKITLAISGLLMAFSSISYGSSVGEPYTATNIRLECESHDYLVEKCSLPPNVKNITRIKTYSNKKLCGRGELEL